MGWWFVGGSAECRFSRMLIRFVGCLSQQHTQFTRSQYVTFASIDALIDDYGSLSIDVLPTSYEFKVNHSREEFGVMVDYLFHETIPFKFGTEEPMDYIIGKKLNQALICLTFFRW